jgi:acyl-CoA thioesterase-1
MKKQFFIFLALIASGSCFADDTNLIYNGGINTSQSIEGWNVVSSGDASATLSLYEESVSWSSNPVYRLAIDVTAINENPEFTDLYVTDSSTFILTAGDSCYLEYYARTEVGGQEAQPMLVSYDAVEGELTTVVFETRTLEDAFNGKKTVSATVAKAGTYQFAFACGASTGTYVLNNIFLYSYAYVADGSPIISSFTVQMEEQGEQGLNQIIGRAIAQDLEGDDYTMSFSIVSGGGSISIIDSTSLYAGGDATSLDTASFIYTETTPGEKIFKVIVTDANGYSNSLTASYTVCDFDTADLYFVEDVWELVREENGYSSNSAFEFQENDPSLPNVLLFGNSISIGYTPYVQDTLNGIANVYRIPDNGGSTLDMLENQDLWIGDTIWDVIHFNWGLHDLKYLLNNVLDTAGEQVVPVEEYTVNMDSIVRILEKVGTHLIFATTSDIPSEAAGRIQGDEVIYNDAALSVMDNYPDVMIDDQYTLCVEECEHNSESDVHYTAASKQIQASQVATKIKEALGLTTTSINEIESYDDAAFYYNMSSESLIINSNYTVNSINIYSISGLKVLSAQAVDQLSISTLEQGIYIVAIKTDDNKLFTQKIIK